MREAFLQRELQCVVAAEAGRVAGSDAGQLRIRFEQLALPDGAPGEAGRARHGDPREGVLWGSNQRRVDGHLSCGAGTVRAEVAVWQRVEVAGDAGVRSA